jgi:hypothetical protein
MPRARAMRLRSGKRLLRTCTRALWASGNRPVLDCSRHAEGRRGGPRRLRTIAGPGGAAPRGGPPGPGPTVSAGTTLRVKLAAPYRVGPSLGAAPSELALGPGLRGQGRRLCHWHAGSPHCGQPEAATPSRRARAWKPPFVTGASSWLTDSFTNLPPPGANRDHDAVTVVGRQPEPNLKSCH